MTAATTTGTHGAGTVSSLDLPDKITVHIILFPTNESFIPPYVSIPKENKTILIHKKLIE
jgi:hypothetical protein